jgi:hypothetical protein
MNRTKFLTFRKCLLLALAGIFLWLLCAVFHPFEPRYQGKRLTAWAKEAFPTYMAMSPELRAKSDRAAAVIQQIGTNALPVALNLCGTKDSCFKRKLEKCTEYNSDGVVKCLITTEWEKHEEGAAIIWALGPVAEPVIPSLIQLLQSQDRDIGLHIVDVLWGVGTNTIPPLIELLDNTNKVVRIRAVAALGHFGREAHAANVAPMVVSAIVHCIQTETNGMYFWALGNFGTNAELSVPVLTNLLGSFKQPFYPPIPAVLGALNRIDPEAAKPFIEEWRAAIELNNIPDPSVKRLTNSSPGIQTNSVPP